jgi:hypothetical protein
MGCDDKNYEEQGENNVFCYTTVPLLILIA